MSRQVPEAAGRVASGAVAQHMADHPEGLSALENLLPVPMIESVDVTEAMVYLCGQSGRYVTGITLPVDAGYTVK
jgi:hypothetical protein